MTILITGGDPIPEEVWDEFMDDELECTWCGGEAVEDNDDPLWYGFDRGQARSGITAPRSIKVDRAEIAERKRREKRREVTGNETCGAMA